MILKDKMAKVIGITGLVASGKTSVSNYFKEASYSVFDADLEVRKLYNNKLFLLKLKKIFPQVFSNMILNKQLLFKIVFSNKNQLKVLEDFIHPIIEKICDSFIQKNQKQDIIFLDIPLLFETGWNVKCDKIILVISNKENQKIRYLARNLENNENKFEEILKNQGSVEQKIRLSDIVIKNNGSLNELYNILESINI